MKVFAFLLLTLPLAADHHKSNKLTAAEKKAGWTLLFDGKSTEHFRNYKKDSVSSKWKIQDGVLTLSGRGGGDIITKE